MNRLLAVQYRRPGHDDTLVQMLLPEPPLIPMIGDLIGLVRVQKSDGNRQWQALTGTGVYIPFHFKGIDIEVDSYMLESLKLVRKWDLELAEWVELGIEELSTLRLFNAPKAWLRGLDERIPGWNDFTTVDKTGDDPVA